MFLEMATKIQGLDSLLRQMQKGYLLSNYISTTPFFWQGDASSMSQGPGRAAGSFPKLLWSLNIFLVTANGIFVTIRCLQNSTDPSASSLIQVYMQFAFIFYFYAVILQVSNFVSRDELAVFVRRYLRCMCKALAETNGSFPLMLRLCPKFLFLLRTWVLTVPLFGACLAYLNPKSPEMWSSVFERPEELPWICRAFFMTLQAYVMLLLTDVGTLWVSSMFPFILFAMDLLKFLE